MRGIYNIGNIKRTKGQQKKHIKQMSQDEVSYLEKKLRRINLKKVKLSNHLKERQAEIGFDFNHIIGVLRNKDIDKSIIEYNETVDRSGFTDRRILLRNKKYQNVTFKTKNNTFFKAKANMCFVVSIETNQIITVYWNKVSDRHRSINWSRYNEDLEIVGEEFFLESI